MALPYYSQAELSSLEADARFLQFLSCAVSTSCYREEAAVPGMREVIQELEIQYEANVRNGAYTLASQFANKIASIHKEAGSYVKALTWLDRDYEYSVRSINQQRRKRNLPPLPIRASDPGPEREHEGCEGAELERELLESLQSLGEVHLRLGEYETAVGFMVSRNPATPQAPEMTSHPFTNHSFAVCRSAVSDAVDLMHTRR